MEGNITVMEGIIGSHREIFNISGPLHITQVDWNNSHHRRSVAASLVQGVYTLERDRQQNRSGSKAQAPPWWDFFGFQLTRQLIDDADNSIFGAIFELKSLAYNPPLKAPIYIIAFRGTICKEDSRLRDFKLNFHCICNSFNKSSRFQLAMHGIHEMVTAVGAANVWLAGHSLGSAVALLAGKHMTKMGYPIETYLFNPPFLSAPIEKLKNQKLKHGIRFTGSMVKAGLAVAVKGRNQRCRDDEQFTKLSEWKPFLFVNSADPVCAEYIGYFEHRKKMEEFGAGKIERIATQNSIRCLLSGGKDSERLHLLPSAYMAINSAKFSDFKRAHGIHQWWDSEHNSHCTLHQFT